MPAYGFAPVQNFPIYGGWVFGYITADGVSGQAWLAREGQPPFSGAGASLDNIGVSATKAGATATIAVNVHTDGNVYQSINGAANVLLFKWLYSGLAADYEIRMTSVSGNPSSGVMNGWLPMSAIRTWQLDRAIVGTISCTLLLEIRKIAAPLAIIDSATVILTATRSS